MKNKRTATYVVTANVHTPFGLETRVWEVQAANPKSAQRKAYQLIGNQTADLVSVAPKSLDTLTPVQAVRWDEHASNH